MLFLQATVSPFSVTSTFTIHNKPVNAFWSLFQVGVACMQRLSSAQPGAWRLQGLHRLHQDHHADLVQSCWSCVGPAQCPL